MLHSVTTLIGITWRIETRDMQSTGVAYVGNVTRALLPVTYPFELGFPASSHALVKQATRPSYTVHHICHHTSSY